MGAKQFHMAGVFRTQTCVMVTSHGSGTSHLNTLPPGQTKGLIEREGRGNEAKEKVIRWLRERVAR